jgi:hypothetical protein
MAAVQFCGRKNIMAAFEKKGIELWSVCKGRELLTAGEGAEELNNFLEMLEPGGSAAEYTIRFYDMDCEPSAIRRDTDYHSCYTVKLTDALYMNNNIGRMSGVDPITAEIQSHISGKVLAAVKRELNGENEVEEETAGEKIMKGIVGLFQDPEKLIAVINGIRNMGPGSVATPVRLGGTNPHRVGSDTLPGAPPTAGELERLQHALDDLGKIDPDIIAHLEQLAKLARTKPDMYWMAIKML